MEEIEQLDPDSTDIFKRNLVDRYIDSLISQYKNDMFGIVDHICFAIFLSHCYLDHEKKDENNTQPDVLGEESKKTSQGISETLPKSLHLMSPSVDLKLRKIRQVSRYRVPNKHLHPEHFTHYLLFMFYPFPDENALKVSNSYCQKLVEEGILYTINENKRFFDPNCEETDNAVIRQSQV